VWDDDEFEHFLGPPEKQVAIVIGMLMRDWGIDEPRAAIVFGYLADQAGLTPEQAALEYLKNGQMRPTL
jgi:hypothetical protein